MSNKITGTIKLIDKTQMISDKFSKREIVVTTDDQYPQHIMLQAVKNKCAMLDDYSIGQKVTAHINIRGREYIRPDGSITYFNTLEVWKIDIEQASGGYTPSQSRKQDTDDVPF